MALITEKMTSTDDGDDDGRQTLSRAFTLAPLIQSSRTVNQNSKIRKSDFVRTIEKNIQLKFEAIQMRFVGGIAF